MLPLFMATLFLSAALLFLVEPMFAKMALPLLGGAPAVWNTCLVFFQAALLAGYGYAHAATNQIRPRRQTLVQLAIFLLAISFLPVHLPKGWLPPAGRNPIGWLLLVLLVSVGGPFFALSTTAPILQKWFAAAGHTSARDPYFLYAASNMGSVLSLLVYPVLIEPHLRLADQSQLWAACYGLFLLLVVGCAVSVWRGGSAWNGLVESVSPIEIPQDSRIPHEVDKVPPGLRMRWIAYAFVPSSLLLGVTTSLTTDLPAIPLLWVIPLIVYLLTFILVFARRPPIEHEHMVERLPVLLLAAAIPTLAKAGFPVLLTLVIEILSFFVAAMVCHGELARQRPAVQHLTDFYLLISLGGVLGGLFNALVAPLIFHSVVEYPLGLFLAALLRPRTLSELKGPGFHWLDLGLPLTIGLWVVGMTRGFEAFGLRAGLLLQIAVFGPALLFCLSLSKRRTRFALGFGVLLVASAIYVGPYGRTLYSNRSFFGVYRVSDDPYGNYRMLFHGSTIHGVQAIDPARRLEPRSYFSPSGPIGQFFHAYSGSPKTKKVGIIGLGIGSLACYGRPDEEFTFYEIDPLVERLARDTRYFTFLRACPPKSNVILGDARLTLHDAPPHSLGVLILDAFSSDTIPVHLVTREAIQLYLSKTNEHGILVFHITNRYLDLSPVLAALARDAGLLALIQEDVHPGLTDSSDWIFSSVWVVMARQADDLTPLARDPRWHLLAAGPRTKVWSDDFSSIWSLIHWN